MTITFAAPSELAIFRCRECRQELEVVYLGIDQADDPRFSFRCPACGSQRTLRFQGASGLPKHPVFDHRGG